MKHAVALVLSHVLIAVTFTAAHAQSPPAPAVPPVTEHAYVIHDFKTESGVTLPEAKIVYGTYGHLNAAATTPSCCLRTTWPTSTVMNGSLAPARPSTRQAVPRHLGTLRQRPLVVALKYAGALSRSAVPRHHHSRQRRSRSSAPH